MAQPKEFYKEEIPKPSGYLHYWYANSDAKSNINALLHQSAQALLIPQLSQYRAKIFNLQNSFVVPKVKGAAIHCHGSPLILSAI